MAVQQLIQPIVNPIAAFDATRAHTINFTVIGGAQVVGNRLVISDNETGTEIYNNKQLTMKLEHTVPAGTLSNGGYYNAVIYTVDNSGAESVASTAVPFYCYSQPVLTIDNIPQTETIENGTYAFVGSYLQQEDESLNSYQYTLYNSNKEVLSQSALIYYEADSSLSYTFVGMSNDTAYYISLTGETVNGTKITSGLRYFTVRYLQPASFAICDLVNNCEDGYIQISSNIVAIDGKSNPDPPVYIDDKEVDLREPDTWVRWDEGFRIQNDFTMRVWGRDFNPYEKIITLTNDINTITTPNKIELKWMLADVIKELPTYVSAKGLNVNLTDSKVGDIQNLTISGNSEQETTEGYNLCPSFNSGTWTLKDGAVVKDNVLTLPNTNSSATSDFIEWNYFNSIKIQFFLNSGNNYHLALDYYDENKKYVASNGNANKDATSNEIIKPFLTYRENLEKAKFIKFTFQRSTSYATNEYSVKNVQISKEDKAYEPFTGGISSPNPNYPSEIYSVGDIKNLISVSDFNITYEQGYSQETNTQFLLKPNYIYTLSFDYNVNDTTTDIYYSVGYGINSYEADIQSRIQYKTLTNGRNSVSFTAPGTIPEGSYLWVKFAQTIILTDINVDVSKIQLESGNKSTDYQSPTLYNIYPTSASKNLYNYDSPIYIIKNNIIYSSIQNGYNIAPQNSTEDCDLAIGYRNLLVPGNTYAISFNQLGSFKYFKLYTTDKNSQEQKQEIEINNGIFVAPDGLYDLQLVFAVDNSLLSNSLEIWNIQIEANNIITEYENYVSNSSIITLDEPLRGSGDRKDLICLESPNVLNHETLSGTVTGSTTYYLNQKGNTEYHIWYYNNEGNLIKFIDEEGHEASGVVGIRGAFTTHKECVKITITKGTDPDVVDITSEELLNNEVIISKSNEAQAYYPYVSQPSIIRYIEQIILNGSESWEVVGSGQKKRFQLTLDNSKSYLTSQIPNIICNYFKANSADNIYKGESGIGFNGKVMWIDDAYGSTIDGYTLDQWKNWLANNPITIIYELDNEAIFPLSQDNTDAFKSLKTYTPISNVFTNNTLLGNMSLDYINNYADQETKNAYVLLKCWNANSMPYVIHSNYIDIPEDTSKVFIWMRRKNNLFDLQIEDLGDYNEDDKPIDTDKPVVALDIDLNNVTQTTIPVTATAIDETGLKTMRFSKDNGISWDEVIPIDGLSSSNSYTFENLNPDTTYTIRVEAIDLSGNIGGISQQVKTKS